MCFLGSLLLGWALALFLLQKWEWRGQALVSGNYLFFYCLLCKNCPLLLSAVRRKIPILSHLSKQLTKKASSKSLNVFVRVVSLLSGIFFKSYDSEFAVAKTAMWISWSSSKLPLLLFPAKPGLILAVFFCTDSGYLRPRKYLKIYILASWKMSVSCHSFDLRILFVQDSSKEIVIQ